MLSSTSSPVVEPSVKSKVFSWKDQPEGETVICLFHLRFNLLLNYLKEGVRRVLIFSKMGLEGFSNFLIL